MGYVYCTIVIIVFCALFCFVVFACVRVCQVSKEAALCLKYNFLANGALDRNEVTMAIEYYDKAIATGYVDQQGVLLVRRGGNYYGM